MISEEVHVEKEIEHIENSLQLNAFTNLFAIAFSH